MSSFTQKGPSKLSNKALNKKLGVEPNEKSKITKFIPKVQFKQLMALLFDLHFPVAFRNETNGCVEEREHLNHSGKTPITTTLAYSRNNFDMHSNPLATRTPF